MRAWSSIPASFTVVLALSGCATTPVYVPPSEPLSASYAAGSAVEARGMAGSHADMVRWWEAFNDPVLTELVEHHGWAELGQQVNIRCFNVDPSIASSLKFLRRTPWAREKVEMLYLTLLCQRRAP